ncbi:MAG: hypothetical protein M9894_28030 [Planctomycetes bacterium]|nr:hypothetical protein [Planctomycetota bacterium]
MRSGWLGLGIVGALVAGCGTNGGWTSSYHDRGPVYDDWSWRQHRHQAAARRDAPPDHRLSDEEVERALAAAPEAGPAVIEPEAADAPVAAAAAEVAAAFRRGDRERARALVAAHPRLIDWSDPGVVVSCRFVGGDLGIELTCVRTDTALGSPREALAVVFEPGTYGVPVGDLAGGGERWTSPETERRFGHWPAPQDLALLRAPVVVIPRGEALGVTYVPVACASFHRGAPEPGTPYALDRFPAGSPIDRLMVVLCQGDGVPDEAEAQLATWLSRDDVSWADFVAQGGDRGRLVTFGRARSVRGWHAEGAARLLLRAGVDPRPLRFFGPAGGRDAVPSTEPTELEAPAPAPAPAPPAPTPAAPAEPAQPASQLS